MTNRETDPGTYECVEPATGERLWQLDLPALDPETRDALTRHLSVCDACRLSRAVGRTTAEGLRNGVLRLDAAQSRLGLGPVLRLLAPGPRLSWARMTAAGGGLAAAACVALLLMLPPVAPDAGVVTRAAGGPEGFLRPVEGEVVWGSRPQLSWHPIGEASAYRVTISAVGGGFEWTGRTPATVLRLPPEASLPAGQRLRAYLEPVPADLAPQSGLSVSFRAGTPGEFLVYRAGAAPGAVRASGVVALVLLGMSLVFARLRGSAARGAV